MTMNDNLDLLLGECGLNPQDPWVSIAVDAATDIVAIELQEGHTVANPNEVIVRYATSIYLRVPTHLR